MRFWTATSRRSYSMVEMMKEDLDFFEIRKKWHMEQGESKQQAVRFAAEEVVERMYGMCSDELKASNFFMELQQKLNGGETRKW